MTEKPQPDSWNMQAAFDIRGLVAALKADDTLVRRRAAAALGGMNAVAAISALQKARMAEDDDETRTVMAAAIAALKSSASEEVITPDEDESDENTGTDDLISQLDSPKATQVIAAATELSERDEKLAVAPLILAFNNQKHSIHVRLAIAEALLKLESAPVEVVLLDNLRNTDWHIRRNAAAILGQLKAEWAIAPLTETLKDPHPVVRRTGLAALKHIGTPESRRALAQFASSDKGQTTATESTPKEVSGIEVKRPGKPEDDDESPLLKRLQQQAAAAEKARRDTEPFQTTETNAANENRFEATQPIRKDVLEDLDKILGEDTDSD